MSTIKGPVFSELSDAESIALLERHHVGRLAFTFRDRVDIEPISYVFRDRWVYARTSPGTKLQTVLHHPWVAFEVDDVRSRVDWSSVVVRGTIYFLEKGSAEHRREYDAAVAILQSADPSAMTDDDATPHRRILFRIHADEITGRRAAPPPT